MPLQWLPLQQRQQQQARQPIRSPVSEALTPRPKGISGEGVAARWEREEAAAAERKFQEKMMKMQHEQGMEKLRFTTGLKEDAAKGITAGQTLGRTPEAAPTAAAMLKEEDIPKAADELFKFIQTLPEEQQIFFLRELQNPTGGSYMTSAGKTVVTTKKNPLFEELIKKRYVLPKEDGTYSWATPIREFEKGTYKTELIGGKVIQTNTATGEEEILFVPESVYFPSSKAAMKGTPDYDEFDKKPVMIKKGEWKVEYVKKGAPAQTPEEEMGEWNRKQFGTFKRHMLSGINDLGFMIDPESRDKYLSMTYEEYMQFMQGETPDRFGDDATDVNTGESVTSNTLFDRILAKVGLQTMPAKSEGAGKPAFNETNVSALIDILPAELTPVQRADLIRQGATDADIDEALRRKKIGSIGEK